MENRTGGTCLVGTNAMLKAAPDGYTLLASTLNTAVMQALGVATAQHSHLAPDVPTMGEAGLPGFEFQSWCDLWVPRGTSPEICEAVNALTQAAMREPANGTRLRGPLWKPVTESFAETRASSPRRSSGNRPAAQLRLQAGLVAAWLRSRTPRPPAEHPGADAPLPTQPGPARLAIAQAGRPRMASGRSTPWKRL